MCGKVVHTVLWKPWVWPHSQSHPLRDCAAGLGLAGFTLALDEPILRVRGQPAIRQDLVKSCLGVRHHHWQMPQQVSQAGKHIHAVQTRAWMTLNNVPRSAPRFRGPGTANWRVRWRAAEIRAPAYEVERIGCGMALSLKKHSEQRPPPFPDPGDESTRKCTASESQAMRMLALALAGNFDAIALPI